MKTNVKSSIIGVALCLVLILALIPLSVFSDAEMASDDIVILYTNDVHSYIDGDLSYDVIAAIKQDLETKYQKVLLVDAGDHVQGTAYGSMDKGESIISLMNAAGYDLATLGNHEFDYGMQGCMNVIDWAEYPYTSCNFYHEENGVRGENVLDAYVMIDCGTEKIAFVGITTPETFSKSTPTYFQDENGNFIYGIAGGDDGSALYADIQAAIDEAKADGATKIVALGHLGVDASSGVWTSENAIANVSGLDAFIDGHSHTVIEGKKVSDKEGNDVVLTQTGEYFDRIGMMVIDSETGAIATDLIEYDAENGRLLSDLYDGIERPSHDSVRLIKENWMAEIDGMLGQKIGSTELVFNNYDEDGNRLVRLQSTNTGDFAADALYYLFDDMGLDVDLAIMNGGGIRNQEITGDLTYKLCKDIHTFGNVACLQTVTGQQILDMLEWGARYAGEAENGSFLHVAGVTYKIDTALPDTTKADELDIWLEGPSFYRVYDVKIYDKETNDWVYLERDAKYKLAGYNYTLRDLGGGFAMLNGSENVLDYVMEDYMVLANYIEAFENGIVGAENSPLLDKYPEMLINYESVYGSGRIEVVTPSVWVGGVLVTKENASDVFGDGKVSYDFATNTLVLNGYVYEGEGYLYDQYDDTDGNTDTDPVWVYSSACIYSSSSLTVELVGNNVLKNSFTDNDNKSYGDAIVADNTLVIKGSGSLVAEGSYAFSAEQKTVIDGCVIDARGNDVAIIIWDGGLQIQNGALVKLDSGYDGIYACGDVTITDSNLTVNAEYDGIYSYNGKLILNSTSVKVYDVKPMLLGTTLSVKAGNYGVFAYGGIEIDGKLTVSSPQNAEIQRLYDEEDDFWYSTVCVEGSHATEFKIAPLGYYVYVEREKNDMKILVPVGQSLNEAYREMFGINDFSEVLITEKDGYSLSGWYTDEVCSYDSEFSFDTKITEDITLYAKWVATPDTIDSVIADLEKAKEALDAAIKAGDASLGEKIEALSKSLDAAILAYGEADAALKSELLSSIAKADETLDAAIKAVQKNLDDAKEALDQAIEKGDGALEEKIEALEKALALTNSRLEAQKDELDEHDTEMATLVAVLWVVSATALAIGVSLGVVVMIKRKKG